MAEIQSFNGGSTSRNQLGDGTNSAVSDSQSPTEQNSQNQTAEKQFSGMTTEERLKSSQSPLDNFLSDTSQLASDTADAVTDLATDAYQGMKEINQEYALGQRAMGALKMLGGAGEAFVGGVGIMAPEPLTSVGGGILFVHGSDVASSGFQEMLTGKPVETVTDQVTTESAKLSGANDVTAQQFGDNVDMAISLGSAGVGAYQALTRPVLAELGPMTIKSSTKADPASELSAGAKTQAGNGAAVTPEVAKSAGPAGKLQATEGASKTNVPEFTTTMRVGSNTSSTFKYVDGVAFRSDLKQHLAGFDGISRTKVLGSHNADNFYSLQNSHQLKIVGETKVAHGIRQVEYQLPRKDAAGNLTGEFKKVEVKTVYDTIVYSDELMLNHAQKAASSGYYQGVKNFHETGNRFYNSTFNGVDFRIALDQDKFGNVFIGNIHPR